MKRIIVILIILNILLVGSLIYILNTETIVSLCLKEKGEVCVDAKYKIVELLGDK